MRFQVIKFEQYLVQNDSKKPLGAIIKEIYPWCNFCTSLNVDFNTASDEHTLI